MNSTARNIFHHHGKINGRFEVKVKYYMEMCVHRTATSINFRQMFSPKIHFHNTEALEKVKNGSMTVRFHYYKLN